MFSFCLTCVKVAKLQTLESYSVKADVSMFAGRISQRCLVVLSGKLTLVAIPSSCVSSMEEGDLLFQELLLFL